MFLPGPIKKIVAIFRGNVSPVFIFLSTLFGFWFGMVHGFSGFHILLIIVVLILNINIGLFLLSAAFGKALILAGAVVMYQAGMWLQSTLPGLYRTLASLPIIGLTDFSNYSVAAGFVIGPVVGIIAGLLLARSVFTFRKMMLKIDEKSETFRKWYSKTWVKILDRLLIGKRTKDIKSMFVKAKYIRKAGVFLALLVVAGGLTAAHFLADTKVRQYAETKMTSINGAQVDINNVGLSMLNGDVSAGGMQFTDPQNPVNNQLSVGKIAADTSTYNLLLGKVYMDKVEVSDVKFGQKRSSPGKLVEKQVAEKPETYDPNKYKVDANDISKLEKYFKDAKALKEKLQKLRKYLPSGKGKTEVAKEKAPKNYFDYLKARAATAVSPRFMAKEAILDKVQIPSALFGNSKILLSNLSDAPAAAGVPVTLDMNSLETKSSMNAKVDYSKPTPEVSGTFNAFDLTKIQSLLGDSAGLTFKSGTASGNFSGTATKEALDLTVSLNLKDFNAQGQGNGVLGLGSDVTNETLSVLHNLSTTIKIVGPVTDPRIVFDVKGLTNEFKQALVKAGKDRALQEFDKRVGSKITEKLGGKVPEEIKKVIPADANSILKGLGGLLGGNKK